jgi:phosphate transport system substrate-binding protein
MRLRLTIPTFILLVTVILLGCKNATNNQAANEGTLYISVDETFKPVMEEQVKVFLSQNDKANIVVRYKSEAECLEDFAKDSTNMVLIARGLTDKEDDAYRNNLGYPVRFGILAYDAVALLTNVNAKDSIYTLQQLQQILSGADSSVKVVLDGNRATSTVRYLQDSVLKGKPFGKNVQAANGSKAVLDYIAATPNSIGFVGSSWVNNLQDKAQLAYFNKIRLALLPCGVCQEKDAYAKPAQSTIMYGQYPLVRPLYYLLKENNSGVGTTFLNFMSLEKGQLIFRRAYVVPGKMYFGRRTSIL